MITDILQLSSLRLVPTAILSLSSRTTTSKHYNPKFKKLRKEKFLKFELPDYNEDTNALPKEKLRQKMKERGMLPPRPWVERPFYISATGNFEIQTRHSLKTRDETGIYINSFCCI